MPLIGLANITVGLLRYAIHELMTGDDDIADQSVALVRQQAVLVLMDRAIDAFGETHEQQEHEENLIGELIARAMRVLEQQPFLTAAQGAGMLDVDPDELEEALEAAVTRGRLAADRRYFLSEPPGPQQ